MSELPKGWLEVELSDVAEVIRGVTYKKGQAIDTPKEGFRPVLRATNITGAALTFDGLVYVPAESVSETQLLRNGDVVIASSSGSKEIVGKAGAFTGSSFVGSFGAFCTGIRPSESLSSSYFGFFFQTPSYRKSVSELSSGSNINNLKTSDLASQRFSLPPHAEQTRIVAKLEELLSDLDAGVAELKAAQKKLGQYRQSLLKAAVEGALTAEWRAARSPLPPGGGGAGGEGDNPLSQARGDGQEPPLPNPSPARGEGLNADDQIWLADRARELRRDQTPDEQALWYQLRGKRFAGYKFRRQQVLGRFIVDFVCFAKRVIVELDGGQHSTAAGRDRARDAWLEQQGFRVLRFWNNEWSSQPEAVLESIWLALQLEPPLPNPSPARGEGLKTASAERGASVALKAPLPLDGGGVGGEGETGAQLLARILTERRARWEAKQLAKFKEQGKTPPKDWQKKYPEPVQPDTAGLPELPEGWVWASAEQLCAFITKGTTPPKDIDDGTSRDVPFLRVTNLTSTGALDFSDQVFIADSTHRGFLARSIVFPGDVLMNIVGPPLGQVSVVPDDYSEWNINQAIAIFRAVAGVANSVLSAWLLSPTAGLWLKSRAKTTAGQTNLTLELCRSLPVPLPPESEQAQIGELIASLLSAANERQSDINISLKQSTAQRQNILRAAFSGQLVPQDPNDEPASVLLERIRAERAAQSQMKNPRARKTQEAA